MQNVCWESFWRQNEAARAARVNGNGVPIEVPEKMFT